MAPSTIPYAGKEQQLCQISEIRSDKIFMIFILILLKKIVCHMMQYMIFQHGLEPALSQQILISFEAILKIIIV